MEKGKNMKRKNCLSKRIISLLLTVIMIISIVPMGMIQASANGTGPEKCTSYGKIKLYWPTGSNKFYVSSDPAYYRTFNGVTKWHAGLDIPVGYGSPVYAVADGVVAQTNPNNVDLNISILHKKLYNGDVYSYYMHMSSVKVSAGQTVKAGDLIGYSGNGKGTYASHLHLEFRRQQWNTELSFISPNPNRQSLKLSGEEPCFHSATYYRGPFEYTKDKSQVTPTSLEKPSAPTGLSVSKNIAAGDNVEITFNYNNKNENVVGYIAVPYTNGKEMFAKNDRPKSKSNKISFTTLPNESSTQNYAVYVYAVNKAEAYNNPASDSTAWVWSGVINFTTHPKSTVTFKNWDGTETKQKVKYGYKAVVPSTPPEREGYTFTGWENVDNPIYSDTVINAKYTRNRYNVNFYKHIKNADGTRSTVKLGDTQKVWYGEDAVAPDVSTFDLPTGHVFASWNDSFENIKENKNIYLVDKWYNDNMKILVSDLVATRDDDGNGYTVTLKVTNNDSAITSGRVIVALKTGEEKLVETTESSAFSLKAGANKTLEIFIPSTRAASIVDAFAVEKFETAIPISVTQRANIQVDDSNLWTDWSTETPPAYALNTQTKTQYRYRDKDYKTSGYDTLAGYTWYNQTTTTSDWSNYVQSVPSNTTTNEGKKTYTSQTYYKYGLYGWTYDGGTDWAYSYGKSESAVLAAAKKYYPGRSDSACRSAIRYFWNYETDGSRDSYKATKSAHYAHSSSNYSQELGTYTVINSVFYKYGTFYKYKTTTTINYFYKWLDWTDWGDSQVSATNNREVETQTVYRYIPKSAMSVEDNTGVQRNVSGVLSSDYAGQQATLFVYKYDEASDWTNEYVGQCIIGQDGSYSFDFILRDEPTIKTGDYTVTLGIEGTDTVIYLDPILAPVEQFTVNYYNPDGTIASTQLVNKGGSAIVPDFIPEKEGYTFTGWSESNTNIKENLDIFPEFKINTYDIVFINWESQSYEVVRFNYGDTIEAPIAMDTESKSFVGWDIFTDGNYVVTSNAVACAVYETKQFTVNFYDWDNNLLSTQNVSYGESAIVPDIQERDGYIFDEWSTYDFNSVDDDLEVKPIFHFETTVETPSASVDTGVYSDNQLVTIMCPTEGAEILYTVDGSDPVTSGTVYTIPISINKSTTLKFVAKKTECNNSEIVTKCYAINKDNMDSEWMSYNELPADVVSHPSEYSMVSAIGYKYKDTISTQSVSQKELLLAQGWTLNSTDWTGWSEYSSTYPVNNDGEIEIDSKDADPVEQTFYNYSHYKYTDPDSGNEIITADEVEGTTGQMETIKLDHALNVHSFVGAKPAYLYNGELWFSQTTSSEFVDPGYDVYSYRTKIFNLYRWTSWTTSAPSAGDERESVSDTVFKYTLPNEYVLSLDYSYSGIADKENETVLVKEGDTIPYDSAYFETPGYTFDGLFTDSGFNNAWSIDTDTVTQSVTLYPKHTIQTFNVTFLDYDGTVISSQDVQYMNFAQVPENPERDGYVFTEWELTSGTDGESVGVVSDLEYTAKYVPEDEYTRVSLSRSKISMVTGSSTTIAAYTTTPNADLIWYSSNPEIATVDAYGKIEAIHSGTAIITVVSLDTYESANCAVTVLGTADTEILPISNSGVLVDANTKYLMGINAGNNTILAINNKLENPDLIYTNSDSTVVYSDNNKVVGTGCKIQLKDANALIDEVTIVVNGDVNGDGAVDGFDAIEVGLATNGAHTIENEYAVAADITGDGEMSSADYAYLVNAASGNI